MRCAPVSSFLADDDGGGTIMGLMWFMLLVGICGLAVDSTDGFRNQTMLQATADATALAAAIDLPDPGAIVATAVAYSEANMGTDINGAVLNPAEVRIGAWQASPYALDTASAFPDAVMVTLHQTEANSNPLPTNFLRIIGLQSWDITAQAVAQRFIPECLRDGLVARGIVDISSNNDFINRICIHGQQGVSMQNHNFYELGVTVSMPDPGGQLTIPAVGMTSNPGLPEALRENILDPRDVNHVNEIMAAMVSGANPLSEYLPSYITDFTVHEEDWKFNLANAVPGSIYKIICAPNKNVSIPANSTVYDVVIIAECNIGVGANASLANVVLGSTALGSGVKPLDSSNINFSANVSLGAPDNCAPGGGVQLFSGASIHFSSSMAIDGLQVVAAGNVELGARDQGINGISVQAGQDITLTSNNAFGLCSGGAPDLFVVPYYRLVL